MLIGADEHHRPFRFRDARHSHLPPSLSGPAAGPAIARGQACPGRPCGQRDNTDERENQAAGPADGNAATVVTVCRSGHRSALAAKMLARGDREVVNLSGGMHAWARAGLPVVTAGGRAGRVVSR
ncbi:MAG TPA: rhodanese-like domain-containing protein [Streptosporangiaceae bacterium]|nr:rhodanese-like domain-containing protein [Streptosporangiaceae bacterium]